MVNIQVVWSKRAFITTSVLALRASARRRNTAAKLKFRRQQIFFAGSQRPSRAWRRAAAEARANKTSTRRANEDRKRERHCWMSAFRFPIAGATFRRKYLLFALRSQVRARLFRRRKIKSEKFDGAPLVFYGRDDFACTREERLKQQENCCKL